MMLACLEMTRPLNGLMSVFAVFVAATLVNFPISYPMLLAFLVVFLVSGAGMVINDYFDYDIDKINRPKRPLPSGRVSKRMALVFAFVLFLIANVLALMLNVQILALTVFNTIVAFVYSWKLKRKLLIGNMTVSWMVASTFIFGSLLTKTLDPIIIILFMLSFSANLGREITKTIEDMKGDMKAKANTLPIVAGKNFAAWVACIFVIFSIFFSFMPYMFGLLGVNYLSLVIVADIFFAISCPLALVTPHKSQKVMKIAMIIALTAFLLGAF
ncbi:MAG: UbiA family prenyltransferase [Candidatus Aenigmarchaeota archaeon]|nr:UbiA family prenyltransferase [Candidatus Aenigmarchaeota archaeon]